MMEFWIFASILLIYGTNFYSQSLLYLQKSREEQERQQRQQRRRDERHHSPPPPLPEDFWQADQEMRVAYEALGMTWPEFRQRLGSRQTKVNWKRDGF